MKTCLICDDHAMMRDALAGLVRLAHPDVIVSQATDFPTAWAAASAAPELILCDLGMPGADPIAGIVALQQAAPLARVIVITGSDDDRLLLRIVQLHVAGLIAKTERPDVIQAAIKRVMSGERSIPSTLEDLEAIHGDGATRLSPRQTEILQAMAIGQTNKEIARRFGLSPATVKAHAAAAFLALGANNRTEATFKARQLGWI